MKIKILFTLLVILLFGCNRLNSGVVVQKTFEPEHLQTYTTFVYNGKTSIPVARIIIIPDRWYIVIEGSANNKTKTARISVSRDEYESIHIGDFFQTGGKHE